jgi:hypothetical protein
MGGLLFFLSQSKNSLDVQLHQFLKVEVLLVYCVLCNYLPLDAIKCGCVSNRNQTKLGANCALFCF